MPTAAPVQRRSIGGRRSSRDEPVADPLAAMRMPNRTGLPDRLKADMEAATGLPMGDVRVHLNSPKPAQLRAHAFAQGTDIHLAPGQERHLPHEAWHVVQQAQGRVPVTTRIAGVGVNADAGLEAEAERMGARLSAFPARSVAVPSVPTLVRPTPVAQRVAAWVDTFEENLQLAFLKRFPRQKALFLEFEAFGVVAPEGDDANDLQSALSVLDRYCGDWVEGDRLAGGIAALKEVAQTIEGSNDIPRPALDTLRRAIDRKITAWRNRPLRDTRSYIEDEKELLLNSDDPGVRGAAKTLLNAASPAFYLNAEQDYLSTPVSHGAREKANLYARSGKHPAYIGTGTTSADLASMTVKGPARGKSQSGGAAHLGYYPNLMTFYRNLIAVPLDDAALDEPKETSPGDGELYDRALAYRLSLCNQVAAQSKRLSRLRVLVANRYSLVMVRFDLQDFLKTYFRKRGGGQKTTDATKKRFTSFLLSYFTGLVNFYARDAGLNATMVERSSFGFLTPSIAETGQSFRINTGLMPPTYADVLVRALTKLDAELVHLAASPQKMKALSETLKGDRYAAYLADPEETDDDAPTEGNTDPPKKKRKRKPGEESTAGRTKRRKRGNTTGATTDTAPTTGAKKRKRSDSGQDLDLSRSGSASGGDEQNAASAKLAKKVRAAENKRNRNNKKVGDIAKLSDAIALAMFQIEKTGKTAIYNATRNRSSLDFVNASAFNAMVRDEASFALGGTLAELMGYLRVEDGTLTSSVDDVDDYGEVSATGSGGASDASLATEHAGLLAFLRTRLEELARQAITETDMGGDAFARRLLAIVPLIRSDNPQFEGALETANELILLYAIKSAEQQDTSAGDGYGSDSEEEDAKTSQGRRLRGKKIITHNGMRALLTSIFASKDFIDSLSGSETNGALISVRLGAAYYEMGDALKLSNDKVTVVDGNKADVLVTDINACVTGTDIPQAKRQLTAGQFKIWVIDTTSATQAQSAEVVEAFRGAPATKLLYLVGSGFKMEQFGADRNQYGTVRAFTDADSEGSIESIFKAIKQSEKPLGSVSHIYRRLMKSLGAVPRNRNLLGGSSTTSRRGSRTGASGGAMETEPSSPTGGRGGYESDGYSGDDDSEMSTDEEETVDDRRNRIAAERFGAFRDALQADPITPEEAPPNPKVDKTPASKFIGVVPEQQITSGAKRAWFDVKLNKGGGDCALFALEGKNLDFEEILALRDKLADRLPDGGSGRISGSTLYQTLHDSSVANVRGLLQDRHTVSIDVMRSLVRVPRIYTGDLEIQAYCALRKIHVFVVTIGGELRRISAGGTKTLMTVAGEGAAALQDGVRDLLNQGAVVLYQSPNHFERIEGVKS